MKQIKTFESCIQSIVALEPCYGQGGGNATRIYTRDGEIFVDKRRLLTVLKKFLKIYGYDLADLRSSYGQYLGCSQSVPLPIADKLALVQLKMRRPLVENDGASGYVSVLDVVNISAMEETSDPSAAKSRLNLAGGHSVPCCFTRRHVEKRLMSGRLALDRYRYLHGINGARPMLLAEKNGCSPDLYEKIRTVSSFLYQLIVDVKV